MIAPILVYIYDRKKKAGPKTAASVELRLTLERKSKYITTGVRLLPKEWHNGIVVNRPDSAELNELLDSIMVCARKVTHAMIGAGELNLDEIPRRMEELTVDKRLFYDYCVDRTKVRIYGKSKDTAARYNRFLDWLKKWGKIIYFSDVTDRNIIKMDEELSAIGMCFVKIIHRKKHLLKVAFWNEDTPAITLCQRHRFEIDIESWWGYSHIKLSFIIRYVLFQVTSQFDMAANPL